MMKNLPKDYKEALSKFLDLDGFIGVIDKISVSDDVVSGYLSPVFEDNKYDFWKFVGVYEQIEDCNVKRGDAEILQLVPYKASNLQYVNEGFVDLEEFKNAVL